MLRDQTPDEALAAATDRVNELEGAIMSARGSIAFHRLDAAEETLHAVTTGRTDWTAAQCGETCLCDEDATCNRLTGRDWLADVREVLADAYTPEGVEVWLDSTSDPKDQSLLTQRVLIEEEGMGAQVLTRAEQTVGRTLDQIRVVEDRPTGPVTTSDVIHDQVLPMNDTRRCQDCGGVRTCRCYVPSPASGPERVPFTAHPLWAVVRKWVAEGRSDGWIAHQLDDPPPAPSGELEEAREALAAYRALADDLNGHARCPSDCASYSGHQCNCGCERDQQRVQILREMFPESANEED